MAKPKKSTKELLKWKKKKWVEIVAPPTLRSMPLGESLVLNPENLVGKSIVSNLMTLTGDMKKQHINVRFIIDSVKEGKAQTKLVSYMLSPATIKRNVRRRRDRVDCVFKCTTKDMQKVNLKLLLVTRSNTSNSALSMLRKKSIDLMTKYVAEVLYEDLFRDIMDFKIQMELKKQLKDVYPLRSCEVRFLGLLNR